MKIEYFLNEMIEKINQVELNLYTLSGSVSHIDKEGENRL